jgi:hypothetical protein
MEEKHHKYVPVPLALRRGSRTRLSFCDKGHTQKRQLAKLYSLCNNDRYCRNLYRATAEEFVVPEASTSPCSGLSVDTILKSD